MYERIYAVCTICMEYIYRDCGKRHGDGQLDTDEQPVWLLADINEMTAGEIEQAESNRLPIC
jgi:hypothetical protein